MKIKHTLMVCLLALASSAHAASVSLVNYSFEDEPSAPTGPGYNGNAPFGWSAFGTKGLQWDDPVPSGIDGNVFVYLQGGTGTVSGIAQQLNLDVSVGDEFTLTLAGLWVNNSADQFTFDIRTDSTYNSGVSLIGGPKTSDVMSKTGFADYDVAGVAETAGSNPYLIIYREEGASGQQRLDNVRLDVSAASVPEPSSAALVGLSGLMLVMRRRR